MDIQSNIKLEQSEIIKKSLVLLGFLLLFGLITVPLYFLMTAGTKDVTPGAVEAAEVPEIPEMSGEDAEFEEFMPMENQTMIPAQESEAEEYAKKVFQLNGAAFFGGMVLILLLYFVYFELLLKKRFYPLMRGDKTAMICGLLAFLLFILPQILLVTLVPNRITKGLASFTGLPWEVAYAIPGIILVYSFVSIWIDTNFNRVVYMDEVPFYYSQFGNGARNLILITGLTTKGLKGLGAGLAWHYRRFSKEYTVYVMDKREEVKEGVTLRELADDIAAVTEHLGIITADVIGVSQGGMIAQYLAVDHPDLVGKLILVATASRMNDSLKNYVNQSVIYAQKGEMEEFLKDSFESDFSREYQSRRKLFVPLIAKLSVPKTNTRFVRLARSMNTLDVYDELEKINCPVLVIGAGQDRVMTLQASEEIAEKLQCKKFVYRNLGHGVCAEAPDFCERVERFLIF